MGHETRLPVPRVCALAGCSEVDDVIDNFAHREATLSSLREQQSVYDARLQELQAEHSRLEAEWAALTFTAESIGSREIRRLDEAVVDADVKLGATRYGEGAIHLCTTHPALLLSLAHQGHVRVQYAGSTCDVICHVALCCVVS